MTLTSRRPWAAAAIIAVIAVFPGCGLQVPVDPDGTLERVEDGVLWAGASPDAGLVHVAGSTVSGPLPDLVGAFAEHYDAEVEWVVGSEETLVTGLENGTLDIAVGGFTAQTPWVDRAGITRGYPGIEGADGREIVVLVPPGENRMLSELELFLDRELAR